MTSRERAVAWKTTAKQEFICEGCGRPFLHYPSQSGGRHCSPACRYVPKPLMPHPTDPTALMVPLSRGKFAVIDRDDAELVRGRSWSAQHSRGKWYAVSRAKTGPGDKQRTDYLHQVITGSNGTDHQDGDGLNNRRANLRPATQTQNNANAAMRVDNTSGFRGVTRDTNGRWIAQVHFRGKHVHIGRFEHPEEAARARDRKAVELFGEYARLNFPRELP